MIQKHSAVVVGYDRIGRHRQVILLWGVDIRMADLPRKKISQAELEEGMEMPPMKQTQCVTQEMLKDPQSAIPKGPNSQGANDCKMSDYKMTGSTASYKMVCTKPQAMTMVGEMKYSGTDAYVGTVQMDMSGQKVSMTMDAKRVGDCTK